MCSWMSGDAIVSGLNFFPLSRIVISSRSASSRNWRSISPFVPSYACSTTFATASSTARMIFALSSRPKGVFSRISPTTCRTSERFLVSFVILRSFL